jgi:hypothetical protein
VAAQEPRPNGEEGPEAAVDNLENNLEMDDGLDLEDHVDNLDNLEASGGSRPRRNKKPPEEVYDADWQEQLKRDKKARVPDQGMKAVDGQEFLVVPPIHKWKRGDLKIPSSVKDIKELPSDQQPYWRAAMRTEMKAHAVNKTMRKIRRPRRKNVIPSKWVFDLKYEDGDQWVTKFKARKVAGGHRQKFGTDYDKTFAATPNLAAVRVIMMCSLLWSLELQQEDVVTAFLIPELPPEETIYMEMGYDPDGNKASGEYVYELLKCLYGLKQASRKWRKGVPSCWLKASNRFTQTHACMCFGEQMVSQCALLLSTWTIFCWQPTIPSCPRSKLSWLASTP